MARFPYVVRAVVVSLGLLAFARPAPATAETTTSVQRESFDLEQFSSCAAGGAGEDVHLTGSLLFVSHRTENAAGGSVFVLGQKFQGVRGVGLTTGDQYRFVGGTSSVVVGAAGSTFVEIVTVNASLIGQGRASKVLAHTTVHITINPNGEFVVDFDKSRFECK